MKTNNIYLSGKSIYAMRFLISQLIIRKLSLALLREYICYASFYVLRNINEMVKPIETNKNKKAMNEEVKFKIGDTVKHKIFFRTYVIRADKANPYPIADNTIWKLKEGYDYIISAIGRYENLDVKENEIENVK